MAVLAGKQGAAAKGRVALAQTGTATPQGPANYAGTGAVQARPVRIAGTTPAGPTPQPTGVPQGPVLPRPAAPQPNQVRDRAFAMSDAQYRANRPQLLASSMVGGVPAPGAPVRPLNPNFTMGASAPKAPTGALGQGSFFRQGSVMPQPDVSSFQRLDGGPQGPPAGWTAERGQATSQRSGTYADNYTSNRQAGDNPLKAGLRAGASEIQGFGSDIANASQGRDGAGNQRPPGETFGPPAQTEEGRQNTDGGARDFLYDAGNYLTDVFMGAAGGATQAINDETQDQFNRFFGKDFYGNLDQVDAYGRGLLDPNAQAAAEAAAREQLMGDIRTQRDEALRMQQGQASRGGVTGSSGTQGIYGQALEQMQAGGRGLAQDAFGRRLQAGQQGSSALLNSLAQRYGIKADQFTSPKEIASMLLGALGEIAPDEFSLG